MRSIPAILATLAIASIGAQALLPPEQPTRRAYTSSAISSSTTPPYHPPEPTKPATTTTTKTTSKSAESYKPEPTSTYTPEHPKPSDKPGEPEYEKFCQTFAFFHGWDLDCGDVSLAFLPVASIRARARLTTCNLIVALWIHCRKVYL